MQIEEKEDSVTPMIFTASQAGTAVEAAIAERKPLVITSESVVWKAFDAVILSISQESQYQELRTELITTSTAKLNYLRICTMLNDSQDSKLLQEAIVKDCLHPLVVVNWERDILGSSDVFEAIKNAIACTKDIVAIKKQLSKDHISQDLNNILHEMETDGSRPPIKTGFRVLDEALGGGLYGGRMYVLGATSSLGKTSLVSSNIAGNIAQGGHDVSIFSLEMSKKELVAKSISRQTYILSGDPRMAKTALELTYRVRPYTETENNYIYKAIETYRDNISNHMYIVEGVGNIGVKKIRENILRHTFLGAYKPVVIVDYLQILARYDDHMNDKQSIDKNIMELKRVAYDFNIPIIVVSSFNRANYLSDVSFASFKESGSIEYSADVVIALQLKIADLEKKTTLKEQNELVNMAKIKNPREIELVILKNRMYKAWSKIDFDYYPQFDYFTEKHLTS